MPERAGGLTPTECAVLGLLARGGSELSGYDLRRLIAGSVGYFWGPARSQIYAVLPRLVAQGLATRREVAQSQRPDKHVYRITPSGERALRAWLAEPVEPEPDRNVFLLKVFFGELGDAAALLDQVRRRRREAEELDAALDQIDAAVTRSDADVYPALTRRYGHAWAKAVVAWAREAEAELEPLVARVQAGA